MSGHHHHNTSESSHQLTVVLIITIGAVIIQWIGVAITGSLALAADAGHQLTDALGITIALIAARIASRPPSPTRTFGYVRAEVLSAVVHAALICAMCVFLGYEAIHRWNSATKVSSTGVMGFALLGLIANFAGVLILRKSSRSNLNVRTAFLDVASDAAVSAVVLASGAIMAVTGWTRLDIVATSFVVITILVRTWGVVVDATRILMEGVPTGISIEDVRSIALNIPGVVDLHDVHVWATTPESTLLSAHIVVEQSEHDSGGTGRILDALESTFESELQITHTTFQIEHPLHQLHEHPRHD
jgi:cobalt-zinc-cadmium efflux system protein